MTKALVTAAYERRLQQEIEIINAKIRELNSERLALERQLIKARRELAGSHDVNRKNSVNRVMIERRVIDALTAKSPLTNADLFDQARQVTFDLNESTFRTHLHRLKAKGVIVKAGRRGRWMLPIPNQPKSVPNVFD